MLEMPGAWNVCCGKPQAMSGAKRKAMWAAKDKFIRAGLPKTVGAHITIHCALGSGHGYWTYSYNI
jgi:hypothetical protein